MKIAFLGSDRIAIPCLEALLQSEVFCEICGVLTQPDRRSGRGQKFQPNPVKKWSCDRGIPLIEPDHLGTQEILWLKERKADLTLIMAYGHILSDDFLNATPCGCFNLHASLLPKYRGASPVETALAMGERETGVTLMRVIPRMDAGPVVDTELVPILSTDCGTSLRKKLSLACVPLILRSISDLFSQNFLETNQKDEQATYCRKLTKEDGRLDFSLTAHEIECRSRAFSDWPGTWFLHNQVRLKVGKLRVCESETSLQPGEREFKKIETLIIGTAEGTIEILELQKPGGKMLPISDFLRGYSIPGKISFSLPSKSIPLVR